MRKSVITQEALEAIVPDSLSYAECLRRLKLAPVGGNYKTIKNKCKEYEIDTSHFTGKGWNVGERFRPVTPPSPISEVLVDDSTFSTYWLGKRLLREKIFPARCDSCQLDTWQELPIPLELDHINGKNNDHRITNLRFLCPNCHAQTPTWRGRNSAI